MKKKTTKHSNPSSLQSNAAPRPKRPLHAFNLFFSMERENIVRELNEQRKSGLETLESTNANFANITRIISERWKTVDPAYKALLEEKVKPDKARYLKELMEWEANQKHEEMRSVLKVEDFKQKQLSKAIKEMQSLERASEDACFSTCQPVVQHTDKSMEEATSRVENKAHVLVNAGPAKPCGSLTFKHADATIEEARSFFKETKTPFLGETTVKPSVGISQDQARAFFLNEAIAQHNLEVPSNDMQAFTGGRLPRRPQYNVTNAFVVSPAFTPNSVCPPFYPAFNSSTGGPRPWTNHSIPMLPYSADHTSFRRNSNMM